MTIRAKVLLFAAVSIGLMSLMGVRLFMGATQGQRIREQVTATQEQLDGYARLGELAWPYLIQLGQTRQAGGDTTPVRHELLARVEQEMLLLEETLDREEQRLPDRWAQVELQEQEALREAMLHWAEWAEARVRAVPADMSIGPTLEAVLYAEFERRVGQRLAAIRRAEQRELEMLRFQWDRNVRLGQRVAWVLPALSVLLVVVLALAILVPLRRSLRELLAVAERIGRGDFDLRTPVEGRDELGTLARAFDRMAGELRASLQEKQRLIRAEAQAAEREARAAELAEANARLRDSLQQLHETQEQLLFADRLASVGRLAAGVGHEINNPLAYILGNLRYVHQELKDSPGAPSEEDRRELLTALAEASEGAERVRVIVQDLKMLSRPDDVALGPVDLGAVVRSAAKMAAHEVRERAQLVEACAAVPTVRANAARLGQVFLNLFINAAHAIPPGRAGENEIRVEARVSTPGHVTVEVRDTGAGIPEENLRRIFDPFFTTKPIGVGTGLGLSVCHRIITSFGGEIRVESQPGRGTSFFITLPMAEERASTAQSAA